MATLPWSFTYSTPSGGSPTTLQNCTSFNFNDGRAGLQEPFKSSTGSITGRVPSSLPTIQVNGIIDIRFSPGGTFFKSVVVADFVINYGTIPAEDTWTIFLEDALAQAGRVTTTASWAAGTDTRNAADAACAGTPVSIDFVIGDVPRSRCSAQSFTNESLLTILQNLVNTEQGEITGNSYGSIFWSSRPTKNAVPIGVFTDGTLGSPTSSDIKYDSLQFAGIATNYFTKATVEAAGVGTQSAGTSGRTVTINTYNETTTEALYAAQYALAEVNVATGLPFEVSCFYEAQTNDTILTRGPTSTATVVFRGASYLVYILERRITSVPGSTRFTYSLTSGQQVGFFTLDSAQYGVLNQNKLGW